MSNTTADSTRRVPTVADSGHIEIMHAAQCVGVLVETGRSGAAVLTPAAARDLARILEQQADAAEEIE
jgi:hypothetical protein